MRMALSHTLSSQQLWSNWDLNPLPARIVIQYPNYYKNLPIVHA